jgi:hypothetical protein
MNKLLIALLISSVLFVSACSGNFKWDNSSELCQEQFNFSCDYYECMGNHTVVPTTASMYYSQKTNCLIEKR